MTAQTLLAPAAPRRLREHVARAESTEPSLIPTPDRGERALVLSASIAGLAAVAATATGLALVLGW